MIDATTLRRRLWTILLASLLLRSLAAAILPPGYDESYYLFYGQHPALSYFDHPIAVGLWAWLGERLGGSILALRLPSLLSYTAACALLAEACRRIHGPRAALISAALASLSPLLFVCGGLMLLPDAPLLLMAALLVWWLARHPLQRPLGAGAAIALGAILGGLSLSKYQSLVLLLSLVALRLQQSLQSRRWRPVETLLVLLSWLLVSSPLWIWNAQNGWISFVFHTARTGSRPGFHLLGPLLLLLSQVLLLFPPIALALLKSLRPSRAEGALEGEAPGMEVRAFEGTLRWLVLPQLALFLLLAGRMQVLQSWMLLAWWLALPLAAGRLAAIWQQDPRRLKRVAWVTAVMTPLLSLVAAGHVRWGLAAPLLPTGLDTSDQLLESASLRRALQQNPQLWKALGEAEVIASNRYELPGFLALALRGHSRAQYTSYGRDSRGFRIWASGINPQARRGVMFSVVGSNRAIATMRSASHFQDLEPLARVPLQRGGRPGVELEFYRFTPAGERPGMPYR